jgi:hypothetical protein
MCYDVLSERNGQTYKTAAILGFLEHAATQFVDGYNCFDKTTHTTKIYMATQVRILVLKAAR